MERGRAMQSAGGRVKRWLSWMVLAALLSCSGGGSEDRSRGRRGAAGQGEEAAVPVEVDVVRQKAMDAYLLTHTTLEGVDRNPLWARIYVPLHSVALGQQAKITVEALPGRTFEGKVRLISPVVDAGSGTVEVTIEISGGADGLRPGMSASVQMIADRHEDAIVVPKRALVYEGAGEGVFVVRGGMARKVEVRTGDAQGDGVEVVGEIGAGDSVIVAGHEGLRDGAKVRLIGERVARVETWTPQGVRWTTKEVDASTGKEKVTGSGEAMAQRRISPDQAQVWRERLMQIPEVKAEYEKRLQNDPELATDPEKQRAFFREMDAKRMQKRRARE